MAWLPISPRRYKAAWLPADLLAAITVLFVAIPQGLAYATIAGLPPAVGLYASTVPTIVAALFRSSSHVLSGPTNALSLLVGAAVLGGLGADPVEVALTLALMVGVIQVLAGVLRLGAIVDFISSAVVSGYITGAGVLIGIGQLHNATGTSGPGGMIWSTISGWIQALPGFEPIAVVVSLGTVVVVVLIRLLNRRLPWRLPSAIVALVVALVLNVMLGLEARGLAVIGDLGQIPAGLPPLTIPDLSLVPRLVSIAVACAVLSLVESSSVGRSIAARTGQQLDASAEFVGQGLSNVAAAFFGGYPVSGSLSRSVLNERVGAKTRLAGALNGVAIVVVLLAFGPMLDHTPIASLAGLMFVVAYDLVDVRRIKTVVRTSRVDAAGFIATVLGTWTLSLDAAIYLGVGISLVLFLRRARLIEVRELVVDDQGVLQERVCDDTAVGKCSGVRVLHIEGALFFGAAGELRDALMGAQAAPEVKAVVVRLKRARGLDVTGATVLAEVARLFRRRDGRLIVVGLTEEEMGVLRRSGAAEAIGDDCLIPARTEWFSALREGIERAVRHCGGPCEQCPLRGLNRVALQRTPDQPAP